MPRRFFTREAAAATATGSRIGIRKGTPLRLLQSGSARSQRFLQGDEPVKARFCALGFERSDDGRAKLRQWPQVLAAAPAVGIGEKFSVTYVGAEQFYGAIMLKNLCLALKQPCEVECRLVGGTGGQSFNRPAGTVYWLFYRWPR